MVISVVAVSILLCIHSVDYVSGQGEQTQACLDAWQAINSNAECQQAFANFDPSTNTGSSPLCSGTCRSLLEGVRDNCPAEVERINLVLNIACMVTSATGSPTLPTTQACSDATLALATNTACTQALADINSPTGSEVVCGEQCRGLLLSFFQNCPNEYFEEDEATQGLDMLCGSGGTGGNTGTNAPIVDCQTALRNYQHRNECHVDNIEEVTPDSMACSSECRTLAYNLADGCQGVYITRTQIDEACGSSGEGVVARGLSIATLLLAATAVLLI